MKAVHGCHELPPANDLTQESLEELIGISPSAQSMVRSITCCGVSKPRFSIGVSTPCHITRCWVLIASS